MVYLAATLLFCQNTAHHHPTCSYEVEGDDANPIPRYGNWPSNWETPDDKRFFCQWKDDCPPCEDSLRGPCPHGDDEWEDGIDDDGDFDFYY